MEMKDKLYIMRDHKYTQGLIDMINYINLIFPTKEMNMIEIGSYAGESTEIFANHFKHVISIDPFIDNYDMKDITCGYMELNKVYDIFVNRINKYSNITHIRKTSDDAINVIKNIKSDINFVYIDGLHTYDQIKKDINNYSPLIKNGFIAGHDYHHVWQGVVDGINETIGIPDVTFIDTSWVKKI
jgi:cephalosporin hydroxylase